MINRTINAPGEWNAGRRATVAIQSWCDESAAIEQRRSASCPRRQRLNLGQSRAYRTARRSPPGIGPSRKLDELTKLEGDMF